MTRPFTLQWGKLQIELQIWFVFMVSHAQKLQLQIMVSKFVVVGGGVTTILDSHFTPN